MNIFWAGQFIQFCRDCRKYHKMPQIKWNSHHKKYFLERKNNCDFTWQNIDIFNIFEINSWLNFILFPPINCCVENYILKTIKKLMDHWYPRYFSATHDVFKCNSCFTDWAILLLAGHMNWSKATCLPSRLRFVHFNTIFVQFTEISWNDWTLPRILHVKLVGHFKSPLYFRSPRPL